MALVVVVVLVAGFATWLPSLGAQAVCEPPTEVRMLTSAEQLAPYQEVADAFEVWVAGQHDGCRAVNVYVYSAPADKAKSALLDGWSADPGNAAGTQYLRDVGPQADVWVPGSHVEFDAVAKDLTAAKTSQVIASTPMVLGVPVSVAGTVGREPSSWLSLLDTVMRNNWGVVRPDPASDTVGELNTAALYSRSARLDPAPRDIEQRVERSLDAGEYPLGGSDGLLCRQRQLTASQRPAAVITSEQALVRYNAGSPIGPACPARQRPQERLSAVYPADTFSIDHLYVQLTWQSEAQSQATRDAATRFRGWLTSDGGNKALLDVGLRPVGRGNDLGPSFSAENGVLADWPFGHPVARIPGADIRRSALETYGRAKRPGRVLLAVDASGSMNEPTGDQAATRFGVAVRGVAASLAKMNQLRDELGLWLFSTSAAPSGVRELMAIGRNTGDVAKGLLEGVQQWRPGGNTPLYRAIADGVRTVGAHDDAAINALVVLTDGEDTASQDWFDDLEREITAHPDVRVFLVAIGDASCDTSIFARLAAETAGQCLPASVATVDDTLTTLFRVLWTKG